MADKCIILRRLLYVAYDGCAAGRYCIVRARAPAAQALPRPQNTRAPLGVRSLNFVSSRKYSPVVGSRSPRRAAESL